MQYPHFYTNVPTIKLQDPLSDFLGAFEDGLVEISYLDCVKLVGHSCPTVAGAYLMAHNGLEALYPGTLPQRGGIKVELKAPKKQEVTGVIGGVIAFIVGASDEGGFKGIGGNFARDHLLHYGNNSLQGAVKLIRVDTGASVTLSYDPSSVAVDERMKPLMGKSLKGLATDEEKALFKTLWQERVEKLLLTTELHGQMITIKTDN